VADTNLGKLARKMRLLGFDVAFDKEAAKEDIIQSMLGDERVILSTDRRLLMHKEIYRGYCVRSDDANHQTLEVLRRFDLANHISPFTRCPHCNDSVEPVEKTEVLEFLEPKTTAFYDDFTRCARCKKIYWEGSHAERLKTFVGWIKEELASA
jgi:uncharacterized protein with PIN domain